jgi:hypothetical protein
MQVFVRTSLLGLSDAWAKLNFKLGTYSSGHPTTERHRVGFDSATVGLLRVLVVSKRFGRSRIATFQSPSTSSASANGLIYDGTRLSTPVGGVSDADRLENAGKASPPTP